MSVSILYTLVSQGQCFYKIMKSYFKIIDRPTLLNRKSKEHTAHYLSKT